MKRVIIESPFARDVNRNLTYLRLAMRDCLLRGEAPYASHGLYTQPGVLDDDVPEEREHGILAGFAWREASDYSVVYCDLGLSGGMKYGIEHARKINHDIVYRAFLNGADKPAVDLVISHEYENGARITVTIDGEIYRACDNETPDEVITKIICEHPLTLVG